MSEAELSTQQAAEIMGISSQTVRQRCEAGLLTARRVGRRQSWRIDGRSVQEYLAHHPPRGRATPGVEAELRSLRQAVEELERRDTRAEMLLGAVERERDRYRADAASVREAALRLNSAAKETQNALAHLVAILQEQSTALDQLLAPASPLDVLP